MIEEFEETSASSNSDMTSSSAPLTTISVEQQLQLRQRMEKFNILLPDSAIPSTLLDNGNTPTESCNLESSPTLTLQTPEQALLYSVPDIEYADGAVEAVSSGDISTSSDLDSSLLSCIGDYKMLVPAC